MSKESHIDMSQAPCVALYIPNLMDYGRVICAVAAFFIAKTNPCWFLFLYFFSFALDAFDGMAARHFNQKSKFGATLDMVCDRIATAGLLMTLSGFYQEYSQFLIFFMMLDVGSHWLQTHSGFMDPTLKNDNHKNLDEKFWILNFYYKNRWGMLFVCLFSETFLLMLYCLHFFPETIAFKWMMSVTFWIFLLKQFISCIQVISASQRIIRYDQLEALEAMKAKQN